MTGRPTEYRLYASDALSRYYFIPLFWILRVFLVFDGFLVVQEASLGLKKASPVLLKYSRTWIGSPWSILIQLIRDCPSHCFVRTLDSFICV